MTTSIEFAKTVTESNLQGGTDRDFSHEETASIQHTNAAIRQAVRQHAVSPNLKGSADPLGSVLLSLIFNILFNRCL